MKKALAMTKQDFESSSVQTEQYKVWHKLFSKEFKQFLNEKGAVAIEIAKPNHFDISGFFTMNNRIYYFSIADLRWSKERMLIRTAKSYKDYTGGSNQFASLDSPEQFEIKFDWITAGG